MVTLLAGILVWLPGCGENPPAAGPTATSTIAVTITNASPRSTRRALRTVRTRQGPWTNASLTVAELLVHYRAATNHAVRSGVLDAITRRQGTEALDGLVVLFQGETDADQKTDILATMASIKDTGAVAALSMGLATNETTEVRLAAIQELRFRDDPAAVPFLEPLLVEENEAIRQKAADAIQMLHTPRISKEQLQRLRERSRPPAPSTPK